MFERREGGILTAGMKILESDASKLKPAAAVVLKRRVILRKHGPSGRRANLLTVVGTTVAGFPAFLWHLTRRTARN